MGLGRQGSPRLLYLLRCLLLFCATWCLGDWEGSVPWCEGSRERGFEPFQVGFSEGGVGFGERRMKSLGRI